MGLNQIFAPSFHKTRVRPVASGTLAGTPLLINARPAVTLTDRGDATRTLAVTGNSITSITFKSGGYTVPAAEAVVAYDGTFEFAVAGVTTGTADDVEVFITAGGALNLTASGNTHYGWTDYPEDYRKEAGRAPVRVGA